MNIFLSLIILGIIIYLFICIVLLFAQNRLIFFPSPVITTTPQDRGLEYEEVWLGLPIKNQTKFSQTEFLNGWFIPNQNTSKVLLYLHGNGENISSNLTQAYPFFELGLSLFLVDYRGYGKSRGKFPTEQQVYEDAQRAWFYLTTERQISPQNIIVFGHSLGGAIAIELGIRHPEISGLIIEGSFTSLIDMANYQTYYKLLPLKLIIHHEFESLAKVKNLKMPILYTHGIADTVIPYQMSEELFAQTQGQKELLLIPQGTHHNIVEMDRQNYIETVKKFLQNIDNYIST